jgi:hypothetical protein
MTLMSSAEPAIEWVIDPEANIAGYFGLSREVAGEAA